MSDFIDISFVGGWELQQKLKRLEIQLQRKIVRGAMRKAMKPVLASAKSFVAVDQGWLKSSLHIKSRTRKGRTKVYVATGTREDLGIPSDAKGYYPAVLEYGTRTRAPQSYLRRAMAQHKTDVISNMRSDIGAGIEREAKK